MSEKKIKQNYLNKIKELQKHNKLYYVESSPIISDKDYDFLKTEIRTHSQCTVSLGQFDRLGNMHAVYTTIRLKHMNDLSIIPNEILPTVLLYGYNLHD